MGVALVLAVLAAVIIVSLLYRCGPDRLRFIMVDPKRVELTFYNSIPHLLTPVITDAKKAILALKWLAHQASSAIIRTVAASDQLDSSCGCRR